MVSHSYSRSHRSPPWVELNLLPSSICHSRTMTYSPPIVPPPVIRSNSISTSPTTTLAASTPASSAISDLYTSSLLHLGNFTTIESWARLSNHLSGVPPSCLSKGGNYHLFKKDIKPVFEG